MRRAAGLLLCPLACAAADAEITALSGTVGAPGGVLAVDRWRLFGAAHAHVPGLQAVAGASVELIDIHDRGVALGRAKTGANGAYAVATPRGFQPSPRYLVRASAAGNRLDAFVTAPRANIDPATDATVRLVLEHSDTRRARASDVAMLLPLVQHLAWEVPRPATGVALSAALLKAAADDEEVFNIAASIGAQGEISGTVTDASGKAVEGVTLVVRDPSTGITRAMTHSLAGGSYRLNVAPGEYTVAAVNETTRSFGVARPAKVAVGHKPAKRDFRLAAGGRVNGATKSPDGAPLTNVRIRVNDRSGHPVAVLRTSDHGGYRLNLAPGTYVLRAENPTLQPYASDLEGKRVDVVANAELKADFVLPGGSMIAGTVAPLAAVQVSEGSRRVAMLRANRAGEYRIWLKPGRYTAQ